MSTSYAQTLPPDVAGGQPGLTTTATGPAATAGPAPLPATLWSPKLTESALLPVGAAYELTLDTGLSGDTITVETVVRLGANSVVLNVGGWLRIGTWTSGAGTAFSVSATLDADTIEDESPVDPTLTSGTWVRLAVVVSPDQLAVVVAGATRVRMPLAGRFLVPSPLTVVTVGNSDAAHDRAVALVALTDEVEATLVTAVRAAESAGMGEVRGAFHRASKANLGGETGPETAVPGGRRQEFELGYAYWTPASGGVTVEGPVWERYAALGAHASMLGLPVADTQHGTAAYATTTRDAVAKVVGDTSRMSRFEHGVIAWSEETGAHEVVGPVARHWLLLGGPASPVGLPVGQRTETRHGYRHGFQFGEVFERYTGAVAEVHGPILDHYDHLGLWDGPLGAPVTDVTTVVDDAGVETGALSSGFEHGLIVWSPGHGALELLEPWRTAYLAQGGPGGELGAPTSGVLTAGGNGVTYVQFEHGFLVHHASTGVRRITHIDVQLVEAVAPSIDDGWEWDGWTPSRDHDAELIVWMSVLRDGAALAGWDKRRFPSGGHAGKSVSLGGETISVPVDATTVLTVIGAAKDWDAWSGDDALGGVLRNYAIDTLWGELGPVGPAYEETGSGGDGSVTYKYSVGLPVGAISAEFREHRWWQFTNGGTDDVSYPTYSKAFADVEAHESWWDTVSNPLDHLFYELAIRNVAEDGNCYGMCNTAVHALPGPSVYRLPLSRYAMPQEKVDAGGFPDQLRTNLNIGHARQLDSAVLGHILSAITLGPIINLVTALDKIGDGTNGELSIISMVNLGGGGHSVLAYGYQPRTGFPDSILVADPNVPFALTADRSMSRIDVDTSGGWTFIDNGAASSSYGSGHGTLLFRIPSSVVRARAVTPMAGLAMGVEQIVSSFTVVGGDVGVETVGTPGGASLTPIPLLQSSPLTRLYAGQGPVAPDAWAVLFSRGAADGGVFFRNRRVQAGVRLAFEDSGIAQLRVEGFDGAAPRVTTSVTGRPAAAHVHVGTALGRAQRPGWSVGAEVTVGIPTATVGLAPLGLGVLLDGLADGPAPIVVVNRPDGVGVSRYLLDEAVAGKRMELRPADMASPFGTQVLVGLGDDIVVSPMI